MSDTHDLSDLTKSPLDDPKVKSRGKEEQTKNSTINVPLHTANILEVIELYRDTKCASLADRSSQRFARFQTYLTEFTAGAPKDIHYAQDADFILSFAQYLLNDRGLSKASAMDILAEFRKVARFAIREGYVPNVDVFPYCYAKLNGDASEPSAVKIASHTKSSVLRLIDCIEIWSYERLAANNLSTPTDKRKAHEKATNFRCLALYLFGLFFYGIEIEDILSLPRADADGKVFVQKYGRYLPLSPIANRLVTIYNLASRNPGFNTEGDTLLSIPHSSISTDDTTDRVSNIKRRIKRVLKALRVDLYTTGSIYDDRISYLMDCGITFTDLQSLIKAKLHGDYATISDELLQRTNRLIETSSNQIRENWYLLRLLPGQKMITIKSDLVQSGLLGDAGTSQRKVYDPIDWMTTENGKINSPLSRFLFFKVPVSGVSGVANMYRNKCFVQRDVANHNFAAINEDELRLMQCAIRDFRDDIELIDKAEWIKNNGDRLKVGGQARIMSGNLKGMVATIIEITGATNNKENRVYLLEYVAGAVTFKTRLHNVELDPIE